MAGDSRGSDERTAAALAYVCAHLEQVRTDLRTGAGGSAEPLDQLLAAVDEGTDLTAPLDLLHAHLQADGDAAGIYGQTGHGAASRAFRPAGVAGAGSPGPVETVYLCPASRCHRVEWPRAATPIPRCEISGEALNRTRL